MRVVPYSPDHLKLITKHNNDISAIETMLRVRAGYADYVSNLGPCYSGFFDDGAYAGSCGIVLAAYPGVGEAWSVLSAEIRGRGMEFHRFMARVVPDEMRHRGLWRLQAYVEAGNERAFKWARSLGFMEGPHLLRAYGPNREDYYLMARVEI